MTPEHARALQELGILVARSAQQLAQHKRQERASEVTKLQILAQAQREENFAILASNIIEAQEKLTQRKMDFVVEIYRDSRALVGNHHASLLEEKRELNRLRFSGTEAQQLDVKRRVGEIEIELIGLASMHIMIGRDANRMAQEIGLPIRLPMVPLIG